MRAIAEIVWEFVVFGSMYFVAAGTIWFEFSPKGDDPLSIKILLGIALVAVPTATIAV